METLSSRRWYGVQGMEAIGTVVANPLKQKVPLMLKGVSVMQLTFVHVETQVGPC